MFFIIPPEPSGSPWIYPYAPSNGVIGLNLASVLPDATTLELPLQPLCSRALR